jgi:dTDP-4-dehydrorhamnose reductase
VRILVAGREGQLARALLEARTRSGVNIVAIGRPELDVTDQASVAAAIAREQPDVLVNAAAFTAVDAAESDPAAALAVNASGAEHAARACAAASIPLIHISTDYVFDGTKPSPYLEGDSTGPLGVYGRSKLEGEIRVARACERHLILRTAWLHSPWGANFVKTMLRLASRERVVRVVDDQRGAPTYVPDLAAIVIALAGRAATGPATPWGIYHAVDAGETSWCGFAEEIFRAASEHGLPAAAVVPITTAQYPTSAARPANSRLDCGKLRRSFGLALPDWRVGVFDCVARLAAPQPAPDAGA